MSWVVDPEILILEVESHPLLYAKSMPEYCNKTMKNSVWQEITKKLSEDWETITYEEKNSRCKEIQTKWKHLRDNFRREYHAQKDVTSGQGARKRKKYRYYDELLFLVPHVKDAITSGNYSTPTYESGQDTQSPPVLNIEHSSAGPSTVTHSISETPRKKKKTNSNFEAEILQAIRDETDEDRTFCLSLVESLKKMDDDNKILAKIGILNVIRGFLNSSRNNCVYQPNQSPFNTRTIGTHFSGTNSKVSFQPSRIYTQTTQQQHLQSTFTEAHDMYHQESQPTLTQAQYLYHQQSYSHPTSSMHRSSSAYSVNSPKFIKIIENRQYRPAYSTVQRLRPHSAQSFINTYNPNICLSPSNTEPSNSTSSVQSPLVIVSSPEEFCMSPDEI